MALARHGFFLGLSEPAAQSSAEGNLEPLRVSEAGAGRPLHRGEEGPGAHAASEASWCRDRKPGQREDLRPNPARPTRGRPGQAGCFLPWKGETMRSSSQGCHEVRIRETTDWVSDRAAGAGACSLQEETAQPCPASGCVHLAHLPTSAGAQRRGGASWAARERGDRTGGRHPSRMSMRQCCQHPRTPVSLSVNKKPSTSRSHILAAHCGRREAGLGVPI